MPTTSRSKSTVFFPMDCGRSNVPIHRSSKSAWSNEGALSSAIGYPSGFSRGFGDSGGCSAYAPIIIDGPEDGQAYATRASGRQTLLGCDAAVERDCKEGAWSRGGGSYRRSYRLYQRP